MSEVCIGIYYLHEMNYAIDNILKWPCCLHFFTSNIPVFFFFLRVCIATLVYTATWLLMQSMLW